MQTLITLKEDGALVGTTQASQLFFYVVQGQCRATVSGETNTLKTGQFVYIPIEKDYKVDQSDPDTQLLTFHKVYEKLGGYEVPPVIFGDAANVEGPTYFG